ncbi:MAG: gliding motility-associated C-terminal domain-containing protein [Bacteroidales bacterium]
MKLTEKATRLIFSVLILGLSGITALSQVVLPVKPLIQSVSIDSVSGLTIIRWEASQTPDIRSYYIYTLDITVTGELLDSVSSETFVYSYDTGTPVPETYTVTAMDKSGNESLLSGNSHKPIKLDITYDSCNSAMLLNWEKYIGWKNNLTGYRIYFKGTEGDFTQLESLDTNAVSFTHEDIDENSYYNYVVEAYDNQGNKSTSNRRQHFTYMPEPPSFINLDYVSVVDNQTVEISFTADLSGEIDDFLLSRANTPQGNFVAVQSVFDVVESSVQLNDNIITRAELYYYRIEALNSCFNTVSYSNTSNNLLLRGSAEESVVRLEWTPYENFETGVEAYLIYRKSQSGEHEYIGAVPAGVHVFTEDLSQTVNQQISGEVSYFVEAHESGTNPLGISGVSKSNELIVDVETKIYLPNAFTPNGDGRNDVFMPVLDFVPEKYTMYIFDRTGKVLFLTYDPLVGWDGTLNGHSNAPEGVYVYHIEYVSFNGISQVRTGNLTLVYP